MELAGKVMDAANKAINNNTVVNCFLFAVFGGLSLRSMNQQRDIETLESQRDSLLKSNKALKSTIWDWKQQLYAQADDNSVVPLSKIKAIYGEAPTLPSAKDAVKTDGASRPKKILI